LPFASVPSRGFGLVVVCLRHIHESALEPTLLQMLGQMARQLLFWRQVPPAEQLLERIGDWTRMFIRRAWILDAVRQFAALQRK